MKLEQNELLQKLFWDYDVETLTLADDRDLIMARVLRLGDWAAVTWLRDCLGDEAIRQWLEQHHGGGLTPPRLRFWELILGLSHRRVTGWIKREERQVWDKRTGP